MIWAATELAVSPVTQKACAAQKILGVHVARPGTGVSRSAKSGHDGGVLNEVNHPEVMVAESDTTISKSGQFNSIPFEHFGGLPHSL